VGLHFFRPRDIKGVDGVGAVFGVVFKEGVTNAGPGAGYENDRHVDGLVAIEVRVE
jgi:hypothetical protein